MDGLTMSPASSLVKFRAGLLGSTLLAALGCDIGSATPTGAGGSAAETTTGSTTQTSSGVGGSDAPPPVDVQAALGHCAPPAGAA